MPYVSPEELFRLRDLDKALAASEAELKAALVAAPRKLIVVEGSAYVTNSSFNTDYGGQQPTRGELTIRIPVPGRDAMTVYERAKKQPYVHARIEFLA